MFLMQELVRWHQKGQLGGNVKCNLCWTWCVTMMNRRNWRERELFLVQEQVCWHEDVFHLERVANCISYWKRCASMNSKNRRET